jgi:hypothetical protein
MSQSPRKPQSKWGTPPEASGGMPPKPDVPAPASALRPSPAPSPQPAAWQRPAQVTPTLADDPAAATPTPAPVVVTPVLAGDADSLTGDPALVDKPAPLATLKEWLRHLSPVYATLAVVSIGSVLFLALAMTSHTTPVAVLMSAGVVTLLAFGLDTAICSVAAYQAGLREEAGHALLFALLGGVSAVICALSMAGTLIMVLVLAG